MKKIRPFTCFLFVVTVAFLIFSPAIIKAGLDTDAAARKKESFKGILTLWQINGWQGGGASISSCLKKCVKDFENKNVYVFIETAVLTPAKAAEKIAAGEKPDLVSFPAGFFDGPSLLTPLDGTNMPNTPLKASALFEGKYYALPFLVDPYMLYINEELLMEKEVEAESLRKLSPELLFRTAETLSFEKKEGKKQRQIHGIALQSEYNASPFAALAFFNQSPAPENTAGSAETAAGEDAIASAQQGAYKIRAAMENGLSLFTDKQAGFLIASAGADAALKTSKKTPPAYEKRPLFHYSDIVQYMGAVETKDRLRAEMCRKFIYSLYSEKNTIRLAQTGAMPVVYDDTLFMDDMPMKEAYTALLQNGVFPNAFTYGAMRESLKTLGPEAAAGKKDALENIRRMLLNKLY